MQIQESSNKSSTVEPGRNYMLSRYNVVVEATLTVPNRPGWGVLGFYRERLVIPKSAGMLRIAEYLLGFYGMTDFLSVHQQQRKKSSGVSDVELSVIAWPRTLCTNNGRVYVETTVQNDTAYLARLPEIVAAAGEFFRTGSFPVMQDEHKVLSFGEFTDRHRVN